MCEATRAAGQGVWTGLSYVANIGFAADPTFVTVGRLAAVEAFASIFRVPANLERYRLTSLRSISSCKGQWSLCVEDTKILHSSHTVYLCVLCGCQNKQRLFPYTALTDWFV